MASSPSSTSLALASDSSSPSSSPSSSTSRDELGVVPPEELSAAELEDDVEDEVADADAEEVDETDLVEVAPASLSVFDDLVERRPVTQAPRATPLPTPGPPATPMASFSATSVGIAGPMPVAAPPVRIAPAARISSSPILAAAAPAPAAPVIPAAPVADGDEGLDTVVLVRAELPLGLAVTSQVAAPAAPMAPAARTTQRSRAELASITDDDGPGDTLILASADVQAAAAAAHPALAPTQVAQVAQVASSTPAAPFAPRHPMPSSGSMPAFRAPHGRSGSIAPMAFDVAPRMIGDATARLPTVSAAHASHTVAPRSKSTSVFLLAGGAFAAAFGVAVAAALAFGGHAEATPSRAAAAARPAPRVAEIARATSGSLEGPLTAPTKDPSLVPDPEPAASTSSLADHVQGRPAPAAPAAPPAAAAATPAAAAPAAPPAPGARTAVAAPPPAANKPAPTPAIPAPAKPTPAKVASASTAAANVPPPAPATNAAPPPAAPAPGAAAATTGTVLVDSELKTVTVDGDYARVSGGRVVVACGRHRIGAGLGSARMIEVPCGGTVSVR